MGWGQVTPFALNSGSQFRADGPPALTSLEYATDFNEVKSLGAINSTTRTAYQTETALFWAENSQITWNHIAQSAAVTRQNSLAQNARLFALLNIAGADTAIAVFDSKYTYDFWRPVAGIRESDPGTGPTGLGDGNPGTVGDINFTPLGAPASNLTGPNFTPPFPAYPSGHAGFGGALFETMRRFYGTDNIAFTFVSDEFNGQTRDHNGNLRPYRPRSFSNLSQAEEENGQSRIYLGIHWRFDKTEGIASGRRVGDYVFDHAFRPTRP